MFYMTTYCNKAHRIVDGKPVDHQCYVIPPKALKLEMDGNVSAALVVLSAAQPLQMHSGVKSRTIDVPESVDENKDE